MDSLIVMTADRPDQAQACLSSYLANRPTPARVLLMDDSRTQSNHSLKIDLPLFSAGRPQREAFVQQLEKQGIPAVVASFCLLGLNGDWFTAGANRNAALLDSSGETILMVDDDTRGNTAIPAESTGSAHIAGHEDPTDIRFFSHPDEARAAALWADFDLFSSVSELGGAKLHELEVKSDGCCVHLKRLLEERGGVVRVVSCGVTGDSGFYSPMHLLWMGSPVTTERLRSSDAVLKTALNSREVIRMASRLTITHGTVCMATAIGLDNHSMLPPFLPVGRNEDGFFGNLLLRCFPEACTAHLPAAIEHRPPSQRRYQRLANEKQTIRLSELIILLLSACPLEGDIAPVKALRELAEYLLEICKSPQQLLHYSRRVVAAARKALLQDIESRWEQYDGGSPMWQLVSGQFRRRLCELIESEDCWKPLEFQHCSESVAVREVSRILMLTATMIAQWPEICDASRYLQSKGVKIAYPLTNKD